VLRVCLALGIAALVVCLLAAACVAPARAQSTEDGAVDALVAGLVASDTYGLVVEDLRTGQRRALNEHRVFAAGSVYKLALAWEVLSRVDLGDVALDDVVTIEDQDVAEPEPRGGFKAGDTPTVREALRAMLSVSSNSAAHAFLRLIGRQAFNVAMTSRGLSSTRVPEDAAEEAADPSQATTSAHDVALILRLLATSQGLTSSSQAELLSALAVGGWPDALRDALPSDVLVLNKTGNLRRASNVGALLISPRSTVVLVVLDQGIDPGDARGVIAEVGLAAYSAYLHSEH
jgi:beta-lactamase class A